MGKDRDGESQSRDTFTQLGIPRLVHEADARRAKRARE